MRTTLLRLEGLLGCLVVHEAGAAQGGEGGGVEGAAERGEGGGGSRGGGEGAGGGAR